MKYSLLLLFSISVFSQSKPLSFKIDNIVAIDSEKGRIFTLEYHLQNISDKPVTFVLDSIAFIPINIGSQSENMYYSIFENTKAIDMNSVFGIKKITDEEIIKKIETETLEYKIEKRSKRILNNIITLQPNEIRKFKAKFYWNKERYRKEGDIEYYINETNPHFIELSFNLMKEVFESKLSPEEYQIISSNPNFITGWYNSNRVEINFKK